MNDIFSQIWRRIMAQFSNRMRHGVDSAVSRGFNSAGNTLKGKKKK
ncbi:hypothetical protein [Vannielia sp.]|nr:hypothetical protein [Vannielia sp.]MDF1872463.1 hypothetical protein [Vannielia sp.]